MKINWWQDYGHRSQKNAQPFCWLARVFLSFNVKNLQFTPIQTIGTKQTHEIKQLLPCCGVNQFKPNEHWLQSHHAVLTEEYSPLFFHWRWRCCRPCCTWWVTLPPVSAYRSRWRWKRPGSLHHLPWSSLPVYPARRMKRRTQQQKCPAHTFSAGSKWKKCSLKF